MSDNCDHNFGTFDDFGVKNDQKVLIDQITLCQNKINELSALVRQIDIYQIAKNDYVQKLSTSLQTDETLKNIKDSEAG